MMGSPSPLDLLGTWQLARSIDDRLLGETSTVEGSTVLSTRDDGRVQWYESGTLHRGDQRLPVFRNLYVEQRSDGWVVTFEDGRDFHPWSPGSTVTHPCGADTYTGAIRIDSADRWTVDWTSLGPAKDYSMFSTLTR